MPNDAETKPIFSGHGRHGRLCNGDLAPVPAAARRWGAFSLLAMWMSEIHSVGGYTFAASLGFLGLTGWQMLVSLLIGLLTLYHLMNLIGRPSLQYGIPFAVVARMAFGVRGAALAAAVRAGAGIISYGLQTYFASTAVQLLVMAIVPAAEAWTRASFLRLSPLAWCCLLFMWCLQLSVFLGGMERIRRFTGFCGPAVYLVIAALAAWIVWQTGFSGLSLRLAPAPATASATVAVMANAAMLIVAYFAAPLLSFGDFARSGTSAAAMKAGNFLGLPVNVLVFANLAAVVTAGTLGVFGHAIMDPALIVERIGNKPVAIAGSVTFVVAAMGSNSVANFVSPAYAIASLWPERIGFRLGGLVASILSVLACPWFLVASPHAITVFAGSFGAVLGPLFGIIVADYYLVKRQAIDAGQLYSMAPDGDFYYEGGWNRRACAALALTAVPCIGVAVSGAYGMMANLGDWGWLIGACAGAAIYRASMGRGAAAAAARTDPPPNVI